MTRSELKQQAKDALHENFGSKMLLFIIPIILGIFSGGNGLRQALDFNDRTSDASGLSGSPALVLIILGVTGIIFLISLVIGLLVQVTVYGGMFNYVKIFRKERNHPAFSNIFTPFRDGSWVKIILLELLQGVILVALSMTIIGIIPAIYLGLGWSQSPYVLLEQLEDGSYHGVWGVLRASSEQMRGLRGNFFVFWLSFFGWYILIALTGGLVGFWTEPYLQMSFVAYHEEVVKNRQAWAA